MAMTRSEIMTVLIWFRSSHYRDFKAFYLEHVCVHLKAEFPNLPSYQHFTVFFGMGSSTFRIFSFGSFPVIDTNKIASSRFLTP